ncbi:MAG: methyltransferase domain-containing protein [Bacteroidales bacterium]
MKKNNIPYSSNLPDWAKNYLLPIRDNLRKFRYSGEGRICPVCGNSSRLFRSFGIIQRKDAQCVHCSSLERHRFVWLYFLRNTNLFDGSPKKMLHVAPERCFEQRLREKLKDDYITADIIDPRVMVNMDITDIKYPDQSFDVIYCSHVLEHVQDDRKAMKEFYRVLNNNGWAILLVPITSEVTYEDPSIVKPQDRLRAFGQEDHVRRYGPDYVDRLREAGFKVDTITVSEFVSEEEAILNGLTSASGEIYFCTK